MSIHGMYRIKTLKARIREQTIMVIHKYVFSFFYKIEHVKIEIGKDFFEAFDEGT